MDIHPDLGHTFQLTREEMLWLMNTMGSKTLFGVDLKEAEYRTRAGHIQMDQKEITKSLQKKGFLHPNVKNFPSIDSQFRIILETILFPEQALLVFHKQMGMGEQFFHVLVKGTTIAWHSFPNDREHYLGLIREPADIVELTVNWFPLFMLPFSPANFRIIKKEFDRMLTLAVLGKKDEAINILASVTLDALEKEKLVRAISDLKLRGSVARFVIENDKVKEGDSIAVLTDGQTGWLISQDNLPHTEGTELTVRRTSSEWAMAVREMVEAFSGRKLSRCLNDPSHKTVHFAISLDELTIALEAINCRDLSLKLLLGLSREMTIEQYPERMKKAQNKLVESGLCTISDGGFPILNEELTQAILPIGIADSFIQITGSKGRPAEDFGVYIIHGKSFTVYHNYGEQLQLLEHGKYCDLCAFIESEFPDFGTEESAKKTGVTISFEALKTAITKTRDTSEVIKVLSEAGMSENEARELADDFSEISFRAVLTRRNALEKKQIDRKQKDNGGAKSLLLLKSRRRSWVFQFSESESLGEGYVTDRADFIKALAIFIA
jgi:hypothetical protein